MSKRKKLKVSAPSDNLLDKSASYTDFMCPICLQILIKPVQMPCKHELCMECFEKHVYDTSLTCPMCRMRISIWVRQNKKTNSLMNEQRWQLIQNLFPQRVQRRLDGLDDLNESYERNNENYNAPVHVISKKGEVRKEYEQQLKQEQAEQDRLEALDLSYINELRQSEREEREKQEELDREAARKLQEEEINHLGVQLKSPSHHQRKLFALFKPKSPMRLRKRAASDGASSSGLKKRTIPKPKSPSENIKSYFKSTPLSTKVISTQSRVSDEEFAKKLQEQFNQRLTPTDSPVKKALFSKNTFSDVENTADQKAPRDNKKILPRNIDSENSPVIF